MASWRMPQGRAVDAVRWVPSSAAAWDRLLLSALFDPDTGKSTLQLNTLRFQNDLMEEDDHQSDADKPWLDLSKEWSLPDRTTSLATSPAVQSEKSTVVTGSIQGSLSLVVVDAVRSSTDPEELMVSSGVHDGEISGLDVQPDTGSCLSVGLDGKINEMKIEPSGPYNKCLHDTRGLASYSAVHWASPVEYVTAGVGMPLQWWDLRRPGGAVSQCRLKWDASMPGFVHSVDVHPSRKHLCVVGGSMGCVFAWDLRWQQEAMKLVTSIVESEVWQVKYDTLTPVSIDSGKLPPVMLCSEDGVLVVVESGGVTELLAEPCAINSFDIDPENGKDIVCGLEYESILYLKRDT